MDKKIKFSGFLCVFLLMVIMFPNISLAEDYYKVKRGDTLWDICDKYYGDPRLWPKLWQINPQIPNPHLIYPGQVLHLREVQPGKEAIQVKPKKDVIDFPEAIEAVGYLKPKPESYVGKILKAKESDKIVLGRGDWVFLKFNRKLPNVDEKYFIYRTSEVHHPKTGERGYVHCILGVLKIEKVHEKLAEAKIVRSYDVVYVGDYLMPYCPISKRIEILKERPHVKATIVASRENATEIGWPHIVYIDAGIERGIKIGHILDVYRKQSPPLPLAYLGRLLIVYVTKNSATAFILKSIQPFHCGDIVK